MKTPRRLGAQLRLQHWLQSAPQTSPASSSLALQPVLPLVLGRVQKPWLSPEDLSQIPSQQSVSAVHVSPDWVQ